MPTAQSKHRVASIIVNAMSIFGEDVRIYVVIGALQIMLDRPDGDDEKELFLLIAALAVMMDAQLQGDNDDIILMVIAALVIIRDGDTDVNDVLLSDVAAFISNAADNTAPLDFDPEEEETEDPEEDEEEEEDPEGIFLTRAAEPTQSRR